MVDKYPREASMRCLALAFPCDIILHVPKPLQGERPMASKRPYWRTSITYFEPNVIRIRGYAIEEIIDRLSFGDTFYLLIKGEVPKRNEGKLIEAILVSCCDHGFLAPSVNAARFAASSGVPLPQAVAAGILAIGKYHGGAIEDCALLLKSIAESGSPQEEAQRLIREKLSRGERIPGYGHPIHTADPRIKALLRKAGELGFAGSYVDLAFEVERILQEETGKPININVDGVIAALVLELGFDPCVASAFFLISRTLGLVAHVYEEATREKPFRTIPEEDILYDGPSSRSLDINKT